MTNTIHTNYFFRIMNNISKELKAIGIPHSMTECHDGYKIVFPWAEGDVAINSYTYHNIEGYVESFQFEWDNDDVSVLTPEEAINKIEEAYNEQYLLSHVDSIFAN